MKKIISILSCISIIGICTAAMAGASADDCVVAVYENGALYSCAYGTYENGTVHAEVKLPAGEYTAKAFFTDNGTVTIEKGFLNPVPDKGTPAPSVTPTPSADVTPTPAPTNNTGTPSPSKTPRPTYHPAYESEKDAVEAIAVVRNVNMTDVNGDTKYSINAYYRAEEVTFNIDEDKIIDSAPDAFSELGGQSVGVLKKGDVIMIACTPSGSLKRVDLIARPVKDDIVTGSTDYGDNFEQLFSCRGVVGGRTDWKAGVYGAKLPSDGTGYVFGVIRAKDKGSVVLVNKDGMDKDAYYIDLSDNVIVYTCDVSDKNEVSVGGAANIIRSGIAKADLDEDDNIKEWKEGGEYNYALVRVVDQTAVEMVLYTGYND